MREIGTSWDRDNRNIMNENFKEVNTRVTNLLLNNPQPSEIVDMRIDEEGVIHPTAKDRVDSEATKRKELAEQLIQSELTVNIPSDFTSLQEAINILSSKLTSNNAIINLNIETGHQLTQGIEIYNKDCSQFRIVSDDNIVTVADAFIGFIIKGENSQLPTLATLIDMRNLGEDGYHASKNSNGKVEVNCGVINAGERGLYINESSTVEANGSVFKGSNYRNVWVTRVSTLSADNGDFSGNKGDNAVYVSQGSRANIPYSDVSNAAQNGIVAVGSRVACREVNVSGAGGTGILGQKGSFITAESANAKNCNQGIHLEGNSNGFFYGADVSNSISYGVRCINGSDAECQNLIALNCGSHAVRAEDISKINLKGGNVKNIASAWSLFIARGGMINAFGVTTPNGPLTVADVSVTAFNTFDGNSGIIFA